MRIRQVSHHIIMHNPKRVYFPVRLTRKLSETQRHTFEKVWSCFLSEKVLFTEGFSTLFSVLCTMHAFPLREHSPNIALLFKHNPPCKVLKCLILDCNYKKNSKKLKKLQKNVFFEVFLSFFEFFLRILL